MGYFSAINFIFFRIDTYNVTWFCIFTFFVFLITYIYRYIYIHIYANIRIRLFLNVLVSAKDRADVVGEPHKEFSIISDFETSSSFG